MRGLDYVIKKTAKELGLPEIETKKLLTGYWKEVADQITRIESTTVAIRKLGVITVSKLKIRNFIFDTIRNIRSMKNSKKYSDISKNNYIELHTRKLRNALIQRNILAKDYAEKFGNI
jgi:hypothetical protein